MSRDPLSAAPAWSGSPFGYGAQNPANASDPTGTRECWGDGDMHDACDQHPVLGTDATAPPASFTPTPGPGVAVPASATPIPAPLSCSQLPTGCAPCLSMPGGCHNEGFLDALTDIIGEYLHDPYNRASLFATVSMAAAAFTCTTTVTSEGLTAALCAGSITVAGHAFYTKYQILSQDVETGKTSQGKALCYASVDVWSIGSPGATIGQRVVASQLCRVVQ